MHDDAGSCSAIKMTKCQQAEDGWCCFGFLSFLLITLFPIMHTCPPQSLSSPHTRQLSITRRIYYFVMQRYGYKHHMTFGLTFRRLGIGQ